MTGDAPCEDGTPILPSAVEPGFGIAEKPRWESRPLPIRRKGNSSSPRQLDEAFQLPDAGGAAHVAEGFGFDLPDALSCSIGSLVDLVNLMGKLPP